MAITTLLPSTGAFMSVSPVHQGLFNKIYNQKKLQLAFPKRYQIACEGACAFVGKVPRGCAECLSLQVKTISGIPNTYVNTEKVCNADCPYCFYFPENGNDISKKNCNHVNLPKDWKDVFKEKLKHPMHPLQVMHHIFEIQETYKHGLLYPVYNFTGDACEPLLYFDVVKEIIKTIKQNIEPGLCQVSEYPGLFKIYTNGILLTEDICKYFGENGIQEIRVNIAASDFSDDVYKNIEIATKYIENVIVEVAVYPPYRKQLLDMVERLNTIPISNVTLCQLKIRDMRVFNKIDKLLPNYSFYKANPHWYVLDDKGLTEDIISKVLYNNYHYSILDCNCFTIGYKDQTSIIKPDNKLEIKRICKLN
jgi:hypothetical protein